MTGFGYSIAMAVEMLNTDHYFICSEHQKHYTMHNTASNRTPGHEALIGAQI